MIKAIVVILLLSLLTGCVKTLEESDTLDSAAIENFDNYVTSIINQNSNLIEFSKDKKLTETEQTLYGFLEAMTRKDYPMAKMLTNYSNALFIEDNDFINALNDYASLIDKTLDNFKYSISDIDDNTKSFYVVIDDLYKYDGVLIKSDNSWKVAIIGLRECVIKSQGDLYINDTLIDNTYKISSDLYKIILPNNKKYLITGDLISSTLSGGLGDENLNITIEQVCTEQETEEFIKWEIDFYSNLYQAMRNNQDLSIYLNNQGLIDLANNAIKTQNEKKISSISIDGFYPAARIDFPIKKIDDRIEAQVTIIYSYSYTDKMGVLNTINQVQAQTTAIFIKNGSDYKMERILTSDPILNNPIFNEL